MVPNFKREEQIVKKARNWIACLLLISGMITVFNSPLTDFLIESYRPVVQATSNSKTTLEDWSDVQLVNLFSVAKARVSHPEVHVIGAVYNEKMHLNTPIANGVDNTIFSLCAGTLKPHEKMGQGNYVLAAHNVDDRSHALFSPLYRNCHKGDEISVTDFNTAYTFRIDKIKVVSANDVSILTDTRQPILTLVTCDSSNSKRVVYVGRLVTIAKYSKLPQHTRDFLTPKYKIKGLI